MAAAATPWPGVPPSGKSTLSRQPVKCPASKVAGCSASGTSSCQAGSVQVRTKLDRSPLRASARGLEIDASCLTTAIQSLPNHSAATCMRLVLQSCVGTFVVKCTSARPVEFAWHGTSCSRRLHGLRFTSVLATAWPKSGAESTANATRLHWLHPPRPLAMPALWPQSTRAPTSRSPLNLCSACRVAPLLS